MGCDDDEISEAEAARREGFEGLLESDYERLELLDGERRVGIVAAIVDRSAGTEKVPDGHPDYLARDVTIIEFKRCDSPEMVKTGWVFKDRFNCLHHIKAYSNSGFTVRCECKVTVNSHRR